MLSFVTSFSNISTWLATKKNNILLQLLKSLSNTMLENSRKIEMLRKNEEKVKALHQNINASVRKIGKMVAFGLQQ